MSSGFDEHGIPCHGSALQIAYYVNCEPQVLADAVCEQSGRDIHWRSPLAAERFVEYKDRQFLWAVEQDALADDLTQWWPRSGPRWDALGVDAGDGTVVLLEAKANLKEIHHGPRCTAGKSGTKQALANRAQIERALASTRRCLGVAEDASEAWMDTHCYQYANRLAHLCFFCRLRVPARLAHVYFTEDVTHIPTSEAHFDMQRASDAARMGLADTAIPSAVGVYLPAVPDAYTRLRALFD